MGTEDNGWERNMMGKNKNKNMAGNILKAWLEQQVSNPSKIFVVAAQRTVSIFIIPNSKLGPENDR